MGRPSLCIGQSTPGLTVHTDGAFAEYVRMREGSSGSEMASLRVSRAAGSRASRAHSRWGPGRSSSARDRRGPIEALRDVATRVGGVADRVVSEPHPKRRALAERLGARAVDPTRS
jgi:threonine dehydrogenase-like Zn-dependent dehydrogenase